MTYRGLPRSGELVVCTVNKVMDFGAFVSLDEFENREGLIHISEVASGWVKYIRDHVREGQKVVCKVLNVNPERGHIDLSLKDVNEHQRRAKIRSWKMDQKAEKWLSRAAGQLGLGNDELEKLEETLLGKFHSYYAIFEELAENGEVALSGMDLRADVAKELARTASENIKAPHVSITGYLDITCPQPDGVDVIKKAIKEALKVEDDVQMEVIYVGAPRYRIKVTTEDYKAAENAMRQAAERAIAVVRKQHGTGAFIRQLEKG